MEITLTERCQRRPAEAVLPSEREPLFAHGERVRCAANGDGLERHVGAAPGVVPLAPVEALNGASGAHRERELRLPNGVPGQRAEVGDAVKRPLGGHHGPLVAVVADDHASVTDCEHVGIGGAEDAIEIALFDVVRDLRRPGTARRDQDGPFGADRDRALG